MRQGQWGKWSRRERLGLGVCEVESLNAYLGAGALQMSFTGLDATAGSPWGTLFVRRLDCEDPWEDKHGRLWFKLSSQVTDEETFYWRRSK